MNFLIEVTVRTLIVVHFLTYYDLYIQGFMLYLMVGISIFWIFLPFKYEWDKHKLEKRIKELEVKENVR